MSRSKATAALLRLKEMDRKYSIKRNEGKRSQGNASTDSSLDDIDKILRVEPGSEDDPASPSVAASKEIGPQLPSPRRRLEVRIPVDRAQADDASISDSGSRKKAGGTPARVADESIRAEGNDRHVAETAESLSSLGDSRDSTDSSRNNVHLSVCAMPSVRSEIPEIISEGTAAEDDAPVSGNDRDDAKTEEATGSIGDKSEIVSELSTAMGKNISDGNVSSGGERRGRYEDDTFEEASSSSESSTVAARKPRESSEGGTIVSGVKQIKITPHKQTEDKQETMVDEERDKEIVELVAPKVLHSASECDIGLDEELSNYVRTTENVDEMVPISLLKLCRRTPSRKHARRARRHRKSSNENTEACSVTSDRERSSERKENNACNGSPIGNGSATSRRSEKTVSASFPEREAIDTAEREISRSKCPSSEGEFLTETPIRSDATSTLRNLNKDAINAIVRGRRVQTSKEVPGKSRHGRNTETVVKLPTADVSGNGEEGNCDGSSLENLATSKIRGHDQRSGEKKARGKKYPRSSKCRKASNCSKVEGKQSRFECRQTHRLRRYAAALRLEQERQDIRNYLLDLERTRLEFGPGASVAASQLPAFKPLEFPKIAAFLKPGADVDESVSRNKDESAGLQERVLMIRQWLKDQYILYRDYSSLARTTNKKYIPASLEDAKRTIRELQKATIKSR